MKKAKLKLDQLNVQSFVTGADRVKGGGLTATLCLNPTIASCAATCDCVFITEEQWCQTLICP